MIDDAEFIRGKVPMTKQEIRVLTLAKARLRSSDIVIDVGAGTGSLSIESAMQCRRVIAIERNIEAIDLIIRNSEKFGVGNIEIIRAEAPRGLDRIECGGSGGRLVDILDALETRLASGGRIVLNCITLQTLSTALEWFRAREQFSCEAIQVQINRLDRIGRLDMMKALNPIFIVDASRRF